LKLRLHLKVLDVGCGDVPKGDVNLDLFFYVQCENFVKAEANHLPFRDGVFTKVYSKHALEHFEDPFEFFKAAKRILKNGGTLECIYPTDTLMTKKTIHNLLNMHWSSAFKWKTKLTGAEKINYGGHKWQLPDERVLRLLRRAGFAEVDFEKIQFPTVRVDRDRKKRKWKIFLNRYLPRWQIETKFIARASNNHKA
jgi:ubiquinone/menaquinone biosynthesis C-methylase UbiE